MIATFRQIRRGAALWAIAGLGVLLSVAALTLARSYDEHRVASIFEQRADWDMVTLERRIRAMLDPLAPLALIIGRQEIAVDELLDQFAEYARSLDSPVRRLSWSIRVPDAGREAFVAAERARRPEGFEIRELDAQGRFVTATRRPEYFPILEEALFDGTVTAIGFDVASDPDRASAVRRAQDNAAATATIAPATTGGQTSLVVRWPIFEGGRVPMQREERPARLRGFVNGAFDPLEVLQRALGDLRGQSLDVSIRSGRYDVAYQNGGGPVLKPGAPAERAPGGLKLQRHLEIYGLPWAINFNISPDLIREERSFTPWLVLVIGLGLTAGTVGYARRTEQDRDRALQIEAAVRDALDRSEARFRDFAQAGSERLWELDADLRVTWVSDNVDGAWLTEPNSLLGRKLTEFRGLDFSEPGTGEMLRAMRAREAFQNLVITQSRLGSTAYLRISAKPLFDAAGQFTGYRATGTNVTEEYAVRTEMRLARERLQDAIESLPCGFLLFDPEERLVAANAWTRDVLRRLGLEEATAMATAVCTGVGRQGLVRGIPEDKDAWCAARLARFRAGDRDEVEEWTDGRWYQVIQRRTANGNSVCLYFDITERRQAEARLQQSQRMEAMGQLTGGIAHDFNNLLLVIIVSLDLLRDVPELEPPFPSLLENAHAAATRAADLTRRLLAFARQQPLQSSVIDIGALVEGMHGLLQRTLGPTIGIELSLPADLWLVANDQSQIENALLNLAINARDAMPRGGNLRIACFNHSGPPEEGQPKGDYVALSVADNGAGMDPDVARRAFDPFFTTKPVGKGTGLGLSMIYGFVRQSGGQVTLKSAPGEGTTVTLFLPRSLAASATPLEELPPAESGHEMILVVEDDADVRATAVQLIEQLGYSVLEAADGPAGLALVHQHPEIALLFTDVVMPGGMRGDELAAAAKALRPGLKILMSSGNFDLGGEAGSQEKMAYPFIAKPYRAQALASRLRETLGEG